MEIYHLTKAYYETQREELELQAFTIFYATRYASSKEKVFKNPFALKQVKKAQTKIITEEERQATINALDDIF